MFKQIVKYCLKFLVTLNVYNPIKILFKLFPNVLKVKLFYKII